MKRKKYIAIAIIILTCVFTISVYSIVDISKEKNSEASKNGFKKDNISTISLPQYVVEDTTPLSQKIIEEQTFKEGWLDVILKENTNKSLDELLPYNSHTLNFYTGKRFVDNTAKNSGCPTLRLMNNVALCRVNHIVTLDNNYKAVVYKVKEENADEAYATILYEKNTICENEFEDIYEDWIVIGEIYYFNVQNKYTYADFSSVKVGDSIESLYQIDSTIKYDVNKKDTSWIEYQKVNGQYNKMSGETFMVYKILSDGIATFEYSRLDQKITSIHFSLYGIDDSIPSVHIFNSKLIDYLYEN